MLVLFFQSFFNNEQFGCRNVFKDLRRQNSVLIISTVSTILSTSFVLRQIGKASTPRK